MYYKVGKVLLQSGSGFLYYKVKQVVLQSGAGITKRDNNKKVGKWKEPEMAIDFGNLLIDSPTIRLVTDSFLLGIPVKLTFFRMKRRKRSHPHHWRICVTCKLEKQLKKFDLNHHFNFLRRVSKENQIFLIHFPISTFIMGCSFFFWFTKPFLSRQFHPINVKERNSEVSKLEEIKGTFWKLIGNKI